MGSEMCIRDRFETSFELLIGEKPKVMGIMPFGCRSFAVKPREAYSKTRIEARAWVGINLGRSAAIPGAYEIFLPSEKKIVTTSEVYFDESFMPLRPLDERRVGDVAPTPPPDLDASTGDGDAPHVNSQEPRPPARSLPQSMQDALARASRKGAGPTSKKVLALFSGPYRRSDGLGSFLETLGLTAVMVDNDAKLGDESHDLLDDTFFRSLLRRAALGEFLAVIAAPPCSTFSIGRFIRSNSSPDGGPPVVRTREHIHGVPNVPPGHEHELRQANELVRRMCTILHVAHGAGSEFVIENPVDRGNSERPKYFHTDQHGPLWLMPDVLTLSAVVGCLSCTFAQCRFGSPVQKYTTFLYSPGLEPAFGPLDKLECDHRPGEHASMAGGVKDAEGEWNSAAYAAFPPELNYFLAQSFARLAMPSGAPASSQEDPPAATNARLETLYPR